MASKFQSRLRILGVLAILGVALFSLKPVGELRKAELLRNPNVHRLKKSKQNGSHPVIQAVPEKADLEMTFAVFNEVPVKIYAPAGHKSKKSLLPAVVFFHGGGWINGSVESYDRYTKKMAMDTKFIVISVEYRLAPKHPFPTPLDDCHKAVMFVFKHAKDLGVNASKVILLGNSAGGNLAAAVSQRMKGLKPPLLAQILIYPVLQSLNFHLPSYAAEKGSAEWMIRMFLPYVTGSITSSLVDAMVLGAHVSDKAHQLYSMYVDFHKLPESFRKGYVPPPRFRKDPSAALLLEPFITNPEINPLISIDLKGLPETLVLTCGLDPLRDDGALYAVRLKEAGVPVRHMHYEGFRHTGCCSGEHARSKTLESLMTPEILKFIRRLLSGRKRFW